MQEENLWVIKSQLMDFGAKFKKFKLASHGKSLCKCFRVNISEFKLLSEELEWASECLLVFVRKLQ